MAFKKWLAYFACANHLVFTQKATPLININVAEIHPERRIKSAWRRLSFEVINYYTKVRTQRFLLITHSRFVCVQHPGFYCKYKPMKNTENRLKFLLIHLTSLPACMHASQTSRLQVCYGCLCGLTILRRVWKIYPKPTVYVDLHILHSNCSICLQCVATIMHQLK